MSIMRTRSMNRGRLTKSNQEDVDKTAEYGKRVGW